ncbi:MAG: type IV toxin-antitoxin system AbiEi family antitoxin domain-containing protein [Candidatus Woesearchaeota archaeon]|nr:type IV toxin-antitoxin system AbiEi family antitoxin domain-containing protein [Candidatus Woesearchaeota archaeon]
MDISNPVVTKADIKKTANMSDSYAYLRLQRLVQQGKLKKIAKGFYTKQDNPLLISSHITHPCYISFLAAAQFYGYTEQIPRTIIINATIRKTIHFEGYTLKFVKQKNIFGYDKIQTTDGELFIATPEKLLLDMLSSPQHAGNFSETIRIIKQAPLHIPTLKQYLKRINNKSLNKRVGFLLEHYKNIQLPPPKDRNYIELEQGKQGKKTNTKWRIRHDIEN